MAPKRGMSAEDKRKTLLAIFHEFKDVFVLKDIEKLGSKRGVVLQSIKDVLQTLVDDDLVHMEKIGSSNYFWSFPSEMSVKLKRDQSRLQGRLEDLRGEREKLQQRLEASRMEKQDSDERQALEAEAAALGTQVDGLHAQLAAYAASDPERYDALRSALPIAVDSANRWLDNLHCLQSWLRKRFPGMEESVASLFREHHFTEDMEYIQV